MAKNPRLIDLTGLRFGLWTVIKQAGNAPGGGALWHTVCDCGNTGTPSGGDLRAGKSTGCGCVRTEKNAAASRTHAGSGTRVYRIWQLMRARCSRTSNPDFAEYGGRGIKVCAEWENFSSFRDWAQSAGYSDKLSIDRINNDLGYEPENCRWATAQTQSENRRFVRCAPDGRPWSAIAKENGIPVMVMHNRISSGGWSHELAATWPLGKRRAPPSERDPKTGRMLPTGRTWHR
jgi:hypothetical protein